MFFKSDESFYIKVRSDINISDRFYTIKVAERSCEVANAGLTAAVLDTGSLLQGGPAWSEFDVYYIVDGYDGELNLSTDDFFFRWPNSNNYYSNYDVDYRDDIATYGDVFALMNGETSFFENLYMNSTNIYGSYVNQSTENLKFVRFGGTAALLYQYSGGGVNVLAEGLGYYPSTISTDVLLIDNFDNYLYLTPKSVDGELVHTLVYTYSNISWQNSCSNISSSPLDDFVFITYNEY